MKAAFTIFVTGEGWHAARAAGGQVELRECERSQDVAGRARAAAEAMAELGYRGGEICLAMGSSWVYPAAIDTDKLPRKQRRQAMIFRLEEQLPLDAEQLTVDFAASRGDRAFGLAVETAKVAQLIDALVEAGLEVGPICPAAMLASWQVARTTRETPDYVLASGSGTLELVGLQAGQPAAWYTAEPTPRGLKRALAADALTRTLPDQPRSLVPIGEVGWPLAQALRESGIQIVETGKEMASPKAMWQLAACSAQRLPAGRPAGWVNLRRDGLAPAGALTAAGGYLKAAAVLLVLVLAATSAGLWWKGRRLQQMGRGDRAAQTRRFLAAYPGQSVPPDVRAYLESQLRKLAGIRGADNEIPYRPNALVTLGEVLEGMPDNMRLRLVDIRIDSGEVYLEGQVRRHSDAQTIYRKLVDRGFVLQPPNTDHLAAGGVSFLLTGTYEPVAEQGAMEVASPLPGTSEVRP